MSDELIRSATLAAYDVLDTEPESAYDTIATLAARLLGCEIGLITLIDGDRIWLKARIGLPMEQIARSGKMCNHVALSGKKLVVSDCAADARFRDGPQVAGEPHIRFYAGVPLLTAEGVCLGSLCVIDRKPQPMPSDQIQDSLERLAGLVIQQLEHRKARGVLRGVADRAQRLETLHAGISAAPTCEQALTLLLSELCTRHGAAIGRIWRLVLPSEVMLEVCRYKGDGDGPVSYFDLRPHAPVTAHNLFTAAAIRSRKPAILRYSEIDKPQSYALVSAAIDAGLQCQVSYPIMVQDQHFGIALGFRANDTPLSDIVADIESLETVIRPALSRKVTEERLLLLGNALDRAADGVLITDAGPELSEAGVIYANTGFCQMTGYSLPEILGRSTLILRGPETDPATGALIAQAMCEWRPIRTEMINYRRDGSPFWVELDLAPMANAEGVITHWVSIRRDITQRRLESSEMVQREKLRSVGQLTGGIAHDFNNLLTVITLNLEEAMRHLPLPASLETLLRPALAASIRGAQLTAQLLSYARRAPLRPRRVRVAEMFETLRDMLQRSLGAQYELVLDVAEAGLSVSVDPSQFENALTNLIINARDAMPAGGRITVSAAQVNLTAGGKGLTDDMSPGPHVRVTVADTGTGIDPAILSRVFDPFFTTKEVGHGSGLGLSMVYGFARQSGGTAGIDATGDTGTVASIILPAVEDAAPQSRPARRTEAWQARGRTVLIVDDHPEVLATVIALMEQLGFAVLSAASGDAALALFQSGRRFDLLFTDVVLPGTVNGLELASQAGLLQPDMRILISSGYAQQTQVLDDLRAKGALVLGKPYKRQDLIDTLQQLFPEAAEGAP